MKRLIAQILVNCALLAALVAAESAYAQTREVYDEDQTREVYDEERAPARAAPGYVDDSCQTGSYGPPVRVEPGDVIEDGEVVGRDPDPNIRTQLEREHSPGGFDEC
jgi:hypothetical protein